MFLVVGVDEESFNHAVDYLLGLPIDAVVFTNGEKDVAGPLVSQLERLLFVDLSEHVQHFLALAEILRGRVQEYSRGILYFSHLIIQLTLHQRL